MATIWTVQQAGNLSRTSDNTDSPWYDGGAQTALASYPGASGNAGADCVVLKNVVNLNIDIDVTLGDPANPNTAYSIRTAGTGGAGTVTVAAGVTVTLQSQALHGNAAWSWAAGSKLHFDNATGFNYLLTDASSQTGFSLTFNGSSSNKCEIKSLQAACQFSKGASNTQSVSFTHVNWINIGSSVNPAITYGQNTSGSSVLFDHCKFDNCGDANNSVAGATGSSTRFLDCEWVNTPASQCIRIQATAARGAGVREIKRCIFDKQFGASSNFNGFTIQDLIITGTFSASATGGQTPDDVSRIYIRHTNTGQSNFPFAVGANGWVYILTHNTEASGLSAPQAIGLSTAVSHDCGRIILDYGNISTPGYGVALPSPSASRTYNLDRILILPSGITGDAVTIGVRAQGNANATASITRFTAPVQSGVPMVRYGESYAGRAGMFPVCKDSVAHTPAGRSPGQIIQQFTGATNIKDVFSVADYNAKLGLASGSDGVGYNGNGGGTIFISPPGSNDVSLATPPFVDSSRNIASWAVHKGVASSGDSYDTKVAAAETLLKSDLSLIADLVDWVKAGWSVNDSSIATAASDGGAIGALGYVVSTAIIPWAIILSDNGAVNMAQHGVSIIIEYEAYNITTGDVVTGDSANHTLYWIKDGVEAAMSAPAKAEIGGGVYSATVTTSEATCKIGTLRGVSSTANVRIKPKTISFIDLSNLDAAVSTRSTFAGGAVASVSGSVGSVTGSVGSVASPVTVGTNNDKTGYALATTPPTAAQIATAVWQDTTAGDFTVEGSVGEHVKALENSEGGGVPTAEEVAAAVWADETGALVAGRLDVEVSSRSAYDGGPVESVIGRVKIDYSDTVPTVNTPGTLGDTLINAWAYVTGKWRKNGNFLEMLGPDGLTIVRTFLYDNIDKPTRRD